MPSEANRTPRTVLFSATDDDRAAAAIERLITAASFDPVKAGGVDAALRIETFGGLHQFGGLDGKVVDAGEARTTPSRQPLNGRAADAALMNGSARCSAFPTVELIARCANRHPVLQTPPSRYVHRGEHEEQTEWVRPLDRSA